MLKRTSMKKVSDKMKERKKVSGIVAINRLHFWFQELWDKMDAVKRCSSCGMRVYGEIRTIYFDHLLPKEKYPELEFEEKNIYFCCANCHTKKENGFPTKEHKEAIDRAKLELLT